MKKMKRILNTLICMAMALLSFSCQEELDIEMPVNESIILDLSSGGLTKATVEDTDRESFINHIDVLIFETGNDNKPAGCFHHEKITVNDPARVVLAVKRTEFESGKKYFVYIVANSSLDLSGITDFSQLNDKKQEDPLLHLTGLHLGAGINNPQYFLMDAVAVDAEGKSPAVLYDGNPANDTVLSAELKRAAAKVVINITAGDKVDFKNYGMAEGSEGGLYYVRNLPYDTYLLAETKAAANIDNANLRTTGKADSEYFTWHPETNPKNVSLITYVYPHQWNTGSLLEKETCVVMNLPMEFTDVNGKKTPYNNSWYKIPMTNNKTFDRNNCYIITINLNRPGASSESEPIKIDNLHYTVEDWTSINVNVGGSNGPDYLQLNTNHVDMYNVNSDSGTLEFASSSPIDIITLEEAYYMNYLDKRVDLSSSDFSKSYPGVYNNIKARAEEGVLNGGIEILSPFIGMTEEEKQQEILKLKKPYFTEAEPEEPSGKPEPVENPGNTRPEDPNTDAVLNEIAAKYSYNAGWYRVTVSWTKDDNGKVTFTDDALFGNSASEQAQEEYNNRVKAYTEYNSRKEAYDQYIADLEAWKTANSDYIAKKQAYDNAYAAYQEKLSQYNEAVDEINNSPGDSHSNAIRYLKFIVKNTTGQTATFTVHQYPTIYITNEKGHYSYRSDFGGTSYEKKGNPNRSGANWKGGQWEYGEKSSGSYFFGSKVATGNEGSYKINYIYWDGSSRKTSSIDGLNNPRMYHVHVTATSPYYIVSIPRLDEDGYTMSSPENTKLVSPSFMIASQLGATMTPDGGINQAKSHCAQYVEVTAGGKVYDDWRLPTAAEIDIIIQHQDISDAMAVVLTGTAYYCAYNTDGNGNVIYTKATGKSGAQNAVRCIRDAY